MTKRPEPGPPCGDLGHADEGYDHVLFKYIKSVLDEEFAGDHEEMKGEVI